MVTSPEKNASCRFVHQLLGNISARGCQPRGDVVKPQLFSNEERGVFRVPRERSNRDEFVQGVKDAPAHAGIVARSFQSPHHQLEGMRTTFVGGIGRGPIGYLTNTNDDRSEGFDVHATSITAREPQDVGGRVLSMRIVLGSDHAGYELKALLVTTLKEWGYEVLDVGTENATDSVDYPDFAEAVARCVVAGEAELGVVVCGSGIGVSIAANKVPGVRAALAHDATSARLAREHNHANVLCLGARLIGPPVAIDALEAWLQATPEQGRHLARIEKLDALDAQLSH